MKLLIAHRSDRIAAESQAALHAAFADLQSQRVTSLAEAGAALRADSSTRLLLLDLDLAPGDHGQAAIASLEAATPSVAVVAMSSDLARGSVMATLRAGAAGLIEASGDPRAFVAAMRVVLDGGIWVPPVIMERRSPDRPGYGTYVPAARQPSEAGLSDIGAQVLRGLVEGLSAERIAREFALSAHAVSAELEAIHLKLGAGTRLEMLLAAARMGLRLRIGQ